MTQTMTRTNNYALRLQSSLMRELKSVAKEEGTSINQLINVAVAEKLATLRTERYFRERMARAKPADYLSILEKSGGGVVLAGDELIKQV